MGKHVRANLPSIAVLASVVVIYLYFVTGGTGDLSVTPLGYYNLLGDAFASGQLHLKLEPPAKLLALDNPYDPRFNPAYRLHDGSLYGGKFYLYWGPFPGILYAIFQLMFGSTLKPAITQIIMMTLACAGFWLVLTRIQRLYLPGVSSLFPIILTLQFSLSPLMIILISRPSHYHEAPIFGLSLLMISWFYLFMFLSEETPKNTHIRNLMLSGILLGIAVMSRATLVIYAITPAFILGIQCIKSMIIDRESRFSIFLQLVSFSVPIAISCIVLMIYNYVRFGSVFEFGMSYVLQGSGEFYDLTKRPDGTLGSFFVPNGIVHGLLLYLFSVPVLTWTAPYAEGSVVFLREHMMSSFSTYVYTEAPMVSIFLIAPVIFFMFALPFLCLGKQDAYLRPVKWLAVNCMLGAAGTLVLLSAGVGASIRYTADMVPGFALAGSLAFMLILHRLRQRSVGSWGARLRRGLAAGLSAFVAVCTVLIVLAGPVYGLMSWRWTYPEQTRRTYVELDNLIARNRKYLLCAVPTWQSRGAASSDAEALTFELDPQCSPFPWAAPVAVRSVTVPSGLPEPIPVTIEVNGQWVADERLYPGVQTLPLDNWGAPEPDGRVVLRLRFPEASLPPVSGLWPIGAVGASSQTELKLAESYREALVRWQIDVERRRGALDQAQTALEQARGELNQLRARAEATPEDPPELQAQAQVIRDLDQRLQELNFEEDAARAAAGDARSKAEQIRARIKADGPTSDAKKKLQAQERIILQLDQRVRDLVAEVGRAQVATDEAHTEMSRLQAKIEAERGLASADAMRRLQAQEQVVSERERVVSAETDQYRPEQNRLSAEFARIQAKQAVVDAAAQP
jgi:hypothetical protein